MIMYRIRLLYTLKGKCTILLFLQTAMWWHNDSKNMIRIVPVIKHAALQKHAR